MLNKMRKTSRSGYKVIRKHITKAFFFNLNLVDIDI